MLVIFSEFHVKKLDQIFGVIGEQVVTLKDELALAFHFGLFIGRVQLKDFL
jgi:hypothetical protein